MKIFSLSTIAATTVATIVVSLSLVSCQGRKMSNMEPLGETVEVVIDRPDSTAVQPAGSEIQNDSVTMP